MIVIIAIITTLIVLDIHSNSEIDNEIIEYLKIIK
ncbi:putative membrane protein [Clostridium beijerinckii]|nr:putative membrane protein [Clostridium beijerinckii]NYC69129.1 putative membrane protein [Clostridium beijerinckii]